MSSASDERTGGDADVVEADVGRPRTLLAHLGVLRADRHACRVGRHQEHRDPRAVIVGGPRTREDDEEVGDAFVMKRSGR